MRIHLIAVGTRMPEWITAGYNEYAKRMPRECCLQLVEIAPGDRRKSRTAEQAREEEGRRMLTAIPRDCEVIALDVAGPACSTEALAGHLAGWLGSGRDTALLIGGPDGLAQACVERANRRWSLSDLTFPHALVRVIVAEQLYRAWTLHQGHPYHRS
ncbi:MAG: 23S rRNA (pseudouridine(1915)-N(3))-methyltransferase RlmH [Gammaproteobacteria bacterium]